LTIEAFRFGTMSTILRLYVVDPEVSVATRVDPFYEGGN